MAAAGARFTKMSGSGNDFVFLDARGASGAHALETPGWIRATCARGTGVGADGVVFLGAPRSEGAAAEVRYYNADGGRAALCGNATLCATRLATELRLGPPSGFALDTDSGRLTVRLRDGHPEIDLAPVEDVRLETPAISPSAGESRIGFAMVGVPHLVVLSADVASVDISSRGADLRRDPSLGAAGANVNFVSGDGRGGWRIRTYERGVEAETLACGTGAVAAAILLAAWDLTPPDAPMELTTRSGRVLRVSPRRVPDGCWSPSLSGEGRIVFRGELAELEPGQLGA